MPFDLRFRIIWNQAHASESMVVLMNSSLNFSNDRKKESPIADGSDFREPVQPRRSSAVRNKWL